MAASTTSKGDSSTVSSNQQGPNPRLKECVGRHYQNAWREPLHPPSIAAFEELQGLLNSGDERRLILDSGCGSGKSTQTLAAMYPEHVVIGIDRSAARLRQLPTGGLTARQGNCIWVRARLETFWRLLYGAGWMVEKHYLLYPNPWPKSEQLSKRWHAHPAFPILLAICGNIEMRTNWKIYAEEFCQAVQLSGYQKPGVELYTPDVPISPFEKKYAASGHELYRVRCSGNELSSHSSAE